MRAARIHHTLAVATASLICSKFMRASSVHSAMRPTMAMMTVRAENRVSLAGSAWAVGVRSTRASRSSWRSRPRRPRASRVAAGRTTRWSIGAMEASCGVVNDREAAAMARSTPTTDAVRARAWARSMRRDNSEEIVSPESQSRSHTRLAESTTTVEESMARCARPAA